MDLKKRAQKIQKSFGKSFYWGTLFFPKEIRYATFIYYAFVRIPDEFVDNEPDSEKSRRKIIDFFNNWREISIERKPINSNHQEIISACNQVFKKYQIPYRYNDIFLKAMTLDLTKNRYQNYQELEEYMFGSASVVGMTMSHLIGFKKESEKDKVLYHAQKLAEAFQMTNFLRDIDEDFHQRNRIYIPQEDLKKFNVSEENFSKKICDQNFKNLMQFEYNRTKKLYREALPGIMMLNFRGRFGILLAKNLYQAILHKIKKAHYQIFNRRIHTTFFDKILLLIKTIFEFIWIHIKK